MVVNALLLVYLAGNGDGGIDLRERRGLKRQKDRRMTYWVCDDAQHGVWADFGADFGKIADNAGICVEEVVPGHAWFTWHASGNEDDLSILHGMLQLLLARESSDLGLGGDVAEISGHTRSVDHVVKCELRHPGVLLQEQRQRLPNSSTGSENSHTGISLRRHFFVNSIFFFTLESYV